MGVRRHLRKARRCKPSPRTQAAPRHPRRYPQRILFFCDCGAQFADRQALESHARACASVDPELHGYPERDAIIDAVESLTLELFKESPEAFNHTLLLLALNEVARVRGLMPPGLLQRYRAGEVIEPEFEATDEEVEEGLIEVGSWYGYSRAEVQNGATRLPLERLAAEREARRRLDQLLSEQARVGIPVLVVLDEWRDEQSGEAMIKTVSLMASYVEEAERRAAADPAYETEAEAVLNRVAGELCEEIKRGSYEKFAGPAMVMGLEDLYRQMGASHGD